MPPVSANVTLNSAMAFFRARRLSEVWSGGLLAEAVHALKAR